MIESERERERGKQDHFWMCTLKWDRIIKLRMITSKMEEDEEEEWLHYVVQTHCETTFNLF